MENLIEINNLTFEYMRIDPDSGEERAVRALNDVSFALEKGSFTAIVGANGSGKSTLAKCLNGLLLPTAGTVLVDGMDTAEDAHLWEIRSTVGMVFQNPDNQIVSSIVEDDVAFGPENIGVPPHEIRRRVDEALWEVGMYEKRHSGAHTLSGGQKQRIAIAGAVAMKPACIVFDEPTAMLDPGGRDKVMEIIASLREEGITIVLITHFMEEAALADRIIAMREGAVLCDGRPQDLFRDSECIAAAGLELPPAVDLCKRLRARGVTLSHEILRGEELVEELCRSKRSN